LGRDQGRKRKGFFGVPEPPREKKEHVAVVTPSSDFRNIFAEKKKRSDGRGDPRRLNAAFCVGRRGAVLVPQKAVLRERKNKERNATTEKKHLCLLS